MEGHLHLSPGQLLVQAVEIGVILGVIRFAAHVRQHSNPHSQVAAFLLAVYG